MYVILPRTASRRLRWPSVRFDHVGDVESYAAGGGGNRRSEPGMKISTTKRKRGGWMGATKSERVKFQSKEVSKTHAPSKSAM